MFRVYIEDGNVPVWAIDEGPGTPQQRFDKVLFNAPGGTNYDLSADNVKQPRFWLEFPEAKLKIINKIALLR